MSFLSSSIGRKMIMAATGFMLLGFLLIHLCGNSLIYVGWINAYGERLHSMPPVVWGFRLFMLAVFMLHIFFGIQLTIENNAARPQAYAVKRNLRATFSGRTMIWTGGLIAVFLVYHLLHFTARLTNPAISSGTDAMGRLDVFRMVVLSFQNPAIASAYIAAMIILALHLTHGIQSFIQTFGLNNNRTIPVVEKAGTGAALIFLLGYAAIPVVIILGLLNYKG
ncbi:MAG TPA: succinate dehydrogenase cytochrome b subunit [Dissulfurispiraceae bacterium]|nr:succinate dehydrogenase cytochrome b subunit [Dissulfurispiraceae bacterium]